MKKLVIGITILGLVGILSACGGSKSTEPTPAPAQQTQPSGNSTTGGTANATAAEATFKNTCAACHGADLAGNIGPNLQHIGSKYTKDQIVGIITNGKGAMPPGLLKSPDKEAVAAWLAAKK